MSHLRSWNRVPSPTPIIVHLEAVPIPIPSLYELLFVFCFFNLLVQNTREKHLKGGGFNFGSQLEDGVHCGKEAWWQKCEVAGHVASTIRKQIIWTAILFWQPYDLIRQERWIFRTHGTDGMGSPYSKFGEPIVKLCDLGQLVELLYFSGSQSSEYINIYLISELLYLGAAWKICI